MRTINRDIVSAIILTKDKKILMGKKDIKKGGVYSDCWHIPGGGVDENENLEQALKREVLEEVGINIQEHAIELIDTEGKGNTEKKLKTGELVDCQMNFNVFIVKVELNARDINIKLSDDLIEYMWIPEGQLCNYKLTPPSVSLFQRLDWLK